MPEPRRLPYGRWPSPISAAMLAEGGAKAAFPEIVDAGVATWLESRPAERGRAVVMRANLAGAAEPDELIPKDASARSRIQEYGGKPYLVAGSRVVFVSAKDQRLWLHDREQNTTVPITEVGGLRFGEPLLDAPRGRVIVSAEELFEGSEPQREPLAGIAAITLDDGARPRGHVEWLARGVFLAAPALSPDGRELAFLAWEHPHMPWDAAALYVAELDEAGSVKGAPRHVAGGPDGAAFQPMYSPQGELFVSLEHPPEAWSLCRVRRDRSVERIATSWGEVGGPLWNLGTRVYGFADARTLIAAHQIDGISHIAELDLETGETRELAADVGLAGELACRGDDVVFVEGWAGGGARLVHLDRKTGARRTLFDAMARLGLEDVPTREAITWETTDGAIAHGLFYAPRNHRALAPEDSKPPLIVVAHGGPTGQASPIPSLATMLFTTRGFAVLDVNYRGSTGYGRAYREALRGRWGEADVADCVRGAAHLAREGRVDRDRLAIRGQSAGGYTVLAALAHHDVFRAGVCHYGVADPRAMEHASVKFESHYDRFLFGEGEARERALSERSPMAKIDHIRAAVAFFHGLDDPAVPASQTRTIYEALRARGVMTEYRGYEGEGHGYRRAETIVDAWTRELDFLERALALD
ncbi:MAG: prolyl oligopeptidase family serine peptidase [Polyangiaceae bacterium]